MSQSAKTSHRARKLRQLQTNAEGLLWSVLRSKQVCGLKFRRQHPIQGYVLDFYCHEARLGIEVDGGQHAGVEQARLDEERTAALEAEGVLVVRYWNHEVLGNRDGVLVAVLELLKGRG